MRYYKLWKNAAYNVYISVNGVVFTTGDLPNPTECK